MRPVLEVADIFRRHGPAYRQAHADHLGGSSAASWRRSRRAGRRRWAGMSSTAPIAGSSATHTTPARPTLPKCQGLARADWLARQAELLPVPYFHVVFTVPAPVADFAFHNKAAAYAILFQAAAEALRAVAARSPLSRRRDRRGRGAAHLGTDLASSSAPALRRARRRNFPGPERAGSPVRPASSCRCACCRAASAAVPAAAAGRLRGRRPALPRRPRGAGRTRRLRRLPRARRASTGWSSPSRRSPAPSRCSAISAATPTASPSPTAA